MSDTPKSDALKDRYALHGIDWYELCRELERENAALCAQLKLETEKADARFDYAKELEQENADLERENVALREDKARLDSGTIALIADGGRRCVWYGRDLRAAIDDARREAQP